jgi:hypothetical protein
MAFDSYAAVCSPLHYMTILNPHLCFSLAIVSWSGGLVNCMIQTSLMMAMVPRGYHLNYFCDVPVFLTLTYEETEGAEAKNLWLESQLLLFQEHYFQTLCTHFQGSAELQVSGWAQKSFWDLWVSPPGGFSAL